MKDVILYNPLSRNGKNITLVKKLTKKLTKKNHEVTSFSLLDIKDIDQFIKEKDDIDRFIIIGGDGTLNRLVNALNERVIKQDVYLYKAGTGNDFARSIKQKGKLINIKQYLFNLPKVYYDEKEVKFLNGVGLGLDGLTCYKVNNSKFKKNKFNYFRHAIEAVVEYEYQDIILKIDNEEPKEINKVLFIAVMNSKYFGGGMKIAPKADRNEKEFQVLVVNRLGKWLLPILLPTIYLGWHVIFKRFVKVYKATYVELDFPTPAYIQVDGETDPNISKIIVKAE